MKKILIYFALAFVCLSSCKKEKKDTPKPVVPGKLYPVTFNVSGFSQKILKTNSLTTDDIPVGMQTLYYAVYEQSTGNFMHYVYERSSSPNFGLFQDSLAAGSYTLIFAGSAGPLVFQYDAQLPDIYFSTGPLQGLFNNWGDTFVAKKDITVTSSVDQDVSLDRIVGELEVALLDTIPAHGGTLTVDITSESDQYFPDSGTSNTPTHLIKLTYAFTVADEGSTTFALDHIMANTSTPFSVHLKLVSSTGVTLGETTVDNVTCEKNKKTILSGNLITADIHDQGFTISVNSDWDTGITTIHF